MSHKASQVGKPSKKDCEGTGIVADIQMNMAGQVLVKSPKDQTTSSISRDPGQDKPHMKVYVDDNTPINK